MKIFGPAYLRWMASITFSGSIPGSDEKKNFVPEFDTGETRPKNLTVVLHESKNWKFWRKKRVFGKKIVTSFRSVWVPANRCFAEEMQVRMKTKQFLLHGMEKTWTSLFHLCDLSHSLPLSHSLSFGWRTLSLSHALDRAVIFHSLSLYLHLRQAHTLTLSFILYFFSAKLVPFSDKKVFQELFWVSWKKFQPSLFLWSHWKSFIIERLTGASFNLP